MAEAAYLELPYPEVGVVDEGSLSEQNLAIACALPDRPLVLGGCCCAHVGAVEGLSARYETLAVVWLDAHGDLNTHQSSPSGNEWGMPLRMLLDSGTVEPGRTALLGARSLDPPEEEFIERTGIVTDSVRLESAITGADAVYVALDVDVLDPAEPVAAHMEEPNGPTLAEIALLLERISVTRPLAGVGLTGLAPDPANPRGLEPLLGALGL